MRKLYLFFSVLFTLLIFFSDQAQATHIRAGEITTVRISDLTYQITITGYRDREGVEWGAGTLFFGHDNEQISLSTNDWFKTNLDGETEINTYVTTHTFPSTGPYTIKYLEANRNDGVLNINNGGSVDVTFYIETQIVIDPIVGLNASPILTVPPIDRAAVGLIYLHNPGAFDREGDSLSYKLVPSKDRENSPVPNFVLPNDPMFGGSRQDSNAPPIFTLDPLTGDIVWDSPALAGEYNFAFIIEEWRKIDGRYLRLGYVTRDMQVIVEETNNKPPVLTIPRDTCITAGTTLEAFISALDPDGHDVKIEAFGGLFTSDIPNSRASLNPLNERQTNPAVSEFRWATTCEHVREQPYEVIFKATDFPPVPAPSLVDIQTWRITVVAPPPENLAAQLNPGREVQLNWDNYADLCAGASSMQVYRKVGAFDFEPDNCETGIPQGVGYTLIAETDIDETGFLDDNNGQGLNPGAEYCYRLVAVFPQPGGGESYVSEEVCVQLAIDLPLITNVDISETSGTNGEINIRWTPPLEIDPVLFPPPYYYQLLRAEGNSGNTNLQEVALNSALDTFAIDSNLNTLGLVYNYRVVLFSGGLGESNIVDTSAVASSVRLEPTPLLGSIELNWQADVPWSINAQNYPIHDIYRDNVDADDPGAFALIASVNVNQGGLSYLDEGLSDQIEYCYYVLTRGSYNHPMLSGIDPLLNRSQKICAQPNDTIPPCAPTVSIELLNCETFLQNEPCDYSDFYNTISWADVEDAECDEDVRSYEIYFSDSGADGSFELITTQTGTSYTHLDLPSFKGCYFVIAVDRSGNRSPASETVCNDNCPNYELPNITTPNGDGKNDVFQAFYPLSPTEYPDGYDRCPRFVEKVNISFYNRWGKEVYNYESSGENSILINWDGRSFDGQRVPAGVYYYLAEIKFDVLDPTKQVQKIKGWVQVLY